MKIQIKNISVSGGLEIQPGEYLVSLRPEQGTIQLSGKGVDFQLPAVKRKSQSKSKVTEIQFYAMGGGNWSLVVYVPKRGEYVSFLQVKRTG